MLSFKSQLERKDISSATITKNTNCRPRRRRSSPSCSFFIFFCPFTSTFIESERGKKIFTIMKRKLRLHVNNIKKNDLNSFRFICRWKYYFRRKFFYFKDNSSSWRFNVFRHPHRSVLKMIESCATRTCVIIIMCRCGLETSLTDCLQITDKNVPDKRPETVVVVKVFFTHGGSSFDN